MKFMKLIPHIATFAKVLVNTLWLYYGGRIPKTKGHGFGWNKFNIVVSLVSHAEYT